MSRAPQHINTLHENAFRLVTLGRLALVRPDGGEDESLRKRRRKLALLAVLALATRPVARDLLAEMFWGDEDEERARHSLSDALSHLRRALGRDAITARQSDVALAPGAALHVDAIELAAAAADPGRVVALYGGPFLDGVYVDGSARFDQWVGRERDRLERLFLKACEARCMALARARQWDECGALAERWLAAAPLSADAALYRLNALKSPGTREADARALAEFRRMEARLRRDYELAPDARVAALAADIAARVQAAGDADDERSTGATAGTVTAPPPAPAGVVEGASPAAHDAAVLAPSGRARPARQARRRWVELAAAALLGGVAVLATYAATRAHPRVPAVPVIAVMPVQIVHGDSASMWLSEGVGQLIAADLARGSGVSVVEPERVRAARANADSPAGAPTSPDDAVALGRKVDASWVVTGGLTHGDTMYVLDLTVRDVATGKALRLYTVTGTSLRELAEAAATHVLDAASSGGSRPALADVDTRSLDAYEHYVRAVQAGDEGRYADERRELDDAIALDSGFVTALTTRRAIAWGDGDPALVARLDTLLRRAAPRASSWDRLVGAIDAAQHDGERARAEQLARALLARYPRDPRAYAELAGLYSSWGWWSAADSLLRRELALDSLATSAGSGPCAPCVAYSGLVDVRVQEGKLDDAERAARRWVELQPDLPAAWAALSYVLHASGQYDLAIAAARRAARLSGGDPGYADRLARVLLVARRYDDVDTMVARWRAGGSPALRESAVDLGALLERERGQYRAADRTMERATAGHPADVLRLLEGDGLGRLGDYAAAIRVFEANAHAEQTTDPLHRPLTGDVARAFSWEHALEAEAIAGSGDTVRLRALADSIELYSARSYFGRDWNLSHHVLGLVAMRGGRYEEAVQQFERARFGSAGWTATLRELARADLALGRPQGAIEALRHAYEAPLDAMGRYQPRSELDLLMAIAFQRAGERDSAAVYAGYVRRAWRDADPEIKRQLMQLGPPR